ncbi:MAG TPA: ABC transporter permease [Vicinamibacterales bacterium]|nr:ABC transporter permease [Vicinamibacterales bacterium]
MLDLRLAVRNLIARPSFSIVALLTLALGIGANTAVFTVFNAVLLSPLPYANPGQIVILNESSPQLPNASVTRYNYDDWRARAKSFSAMGAFRPTSMTITGTGEPERVPAKMITANLLPLLGVPIEQGRGFAEQDDKPGAEGVAMVGAALAARRFGSASPVGQSILLDNRSYTIVGVMPAHFELFQPADVYVPFGPWAATLPEDRGWHPGIFPIARLNDGVSIEQARGELDTISRQLEAEYPDSNKNTRALINLAQDQLVQNVRPALLMLLGAVTLVLLIACANVANLLLARAVGRQKEIAVRVAIGAGRARIIRQLVIESMVLSCAGGALGLIVAMWSVSMLSSMTLGLPRAQGIAVDWPVALFTLALSVVTGLVFGAVPAWQATRVDIRESLNEESRGGSSSIRHRRMRSVLVVAEIALALILLVGAGLLLRSFSALTNVSPGFDPRNLLVINLPLSPRTYGDAVVRNTSVERIVERVKALPGVERAAISTMIPMAGAGATIHFNRAAAQPKGPEDYVMAGYRAVTPEYLSAIGVPLTRGRLLDARDQAGAPGVVVINESMARQYFDGLDPLGQRMQIGTEPDPNFATMEVVGVVADVKQSFEAGSKAEFFVPYAQFPDPILTGMYLNVALVIRTAGEPTAIVPSVRAALREIDPNQPLVNVRTMETAMAGTVAQPRLQMALLVLFASIAAVLAILGVYGVMAYTVSQRIAEIGVRMAIGASPSNVIGLVVRQGAMLAAAGVAIGLLGAAAAARAIQSLLFVEARGFAPMAFAGSAIILGVAALLASYIPARRAAKVSPVTALGR